MADRRPMCERRRPGANILDSAICNSDRIRRLAGYKLVATLHSWRRILKTRTKSLMAGENVCDNLAARAWVKSENGGLSARLTNRALACRSSRQYLYSG